MNGHSNIKDVIEDSLINILQTTKFEKITVTMIAKHAGISNQTFYRYFADKYDLALKISFEKLSAFASIYGNNSTWKEVSLSIFHSIKNHSLFFKRLIKDPEGEELILRSLINISNNFTGSPVSRYALAVWKENLEEWCDCGFRTPIDEVYERLTRNLPISDVVTDESQLNDYIKTYGELRMNYFSNNKKRL